VKGAVYKRTRVVAAATALVAAALAVSNPIAGSATHATHATHIANSAPGPSYRLVSADGGVFAYGDSGFYGSLDTPNLRQPIVGMAPTPSGSGYWLVAADGGVFSFGDANFYGSMGGQPLSHPIVGMAPTPSGSGYWLVAADGGVFSFGDANFYGSMGARHLGQPVVGMAVAPDGNGYWLVAADGGVFSFGDAIFVGSKGGTPVSYPIVGMAATSSGEGYWLVAADGGVFSFGDANFFGSMGGQPLRNPIVGMAATPSGTGYWLVAGDGGVFAFGSAGYQGSAVGAVDGSPTLGITGAGLPQQAITISHSFGNAATDGWQPWGSITLLNGQLWGRTTYGGTFQQGGVIWTMEPGSPTSYRIVHSFGGNTTYEDGTIGSDVANPHHDSLRVGPDGRTLYGAALYGGTDNEGGVYALDTTTGIYTVLHAFDGLVPSSDSGSNPKGLTNDGAQPHSNAVPIMASSGQTVLVGMTAFGGSEGAGTLYEMGLNGSNFTVLHSFADADGDVPHGFVIQIGSVLYGMTRLGGIKAPRSNFSSDDAFKPYKDGNGVVFSYDLTTSTYTVLHRFAYTGPLGQTGDGAVPDHGGLTLVGNRLYGLTTLGGPDGGGELFSLNADGSDYRTDHVFGPPGGTGDLSEPHGTLIPGPGGTLFALAADGGSSKNGGVLEYVPGVGTGAYRVLASFTGGSGGAVGLDNPVVVPGPDGITLYGMSQLGGIDSVISPTPIAPDFDPKQPAKANGTIWSVTVPA
jgi:uncharacterized repeat protein (TIGR03803 family)